MINSKAVAYYRVSTAKQGASGLGIAAQRASVEALCTSRGWKIIAPEFVEVESGKRNDRPELTAAIERCRLTGATLVVAKVDRLSRNLAFLATLQESGISFIAADMPEANELTVHIMAAVAQAERKMISERTKAALAAAKARGQRLGNPNGAAALHRAGKGTIAAQAAVIAKADGHAKQLAPTLNRLREEGSKSLGQLAKALNAEGIMTPRGGRWHPSSVRNVLARLAA